MQKKAAALQEARNIYSQYLSEVNYSSEVVKTQGQIKVDSYYFKVENGQLDTEPAESSYSVESYPMIDTKAPSSN